ncbi:hypothetical protein [Microcoleus sp. bin38.metabat.b11b12b14.051]|uniref:hypothetical protein n=1 Tax=Microcoleus sp. bin38.metabat.b11b12b14.051 TaxID=2742709 RepID=UPI0025FF8E23|nr:hypothetical protein [Microcoleus sp. bin38.metabat.b11b12b14.051]
MSTTSLNSFAYLAKNPSIGTGHPWRSFLEEYCESPPQLDRADASQSEASEVRLNSGARFKLNSIPIKRFSLHAGRTRKQDRLLWPLVTNNSHHELPDGAALVLLGAVHQCPATDRPPPQGERIGIISIARNHDRVQKYTKHPTAPVLE